MSSTKVVTCYIVRLHSPGLVVSLPGHVFLATSRLLSEGRVSGWTYLAIPYTRSSGGCRGGGERDFHEGFLQKFTLDFDLET